MFPNCFELEIQGDDSRVGLEHLTDLMFWLRRIGDLDITRQPTQRGDEARHGRRPDWRIDGLVVLDGPEAAPAIRVRAPNFR